MDKQYNRFLCVCLKEQISIIDDGIAIHLSVDNVPANLRLGLRNRFKNIWQAIRYGIPPSFNLVLVDIERMRLLDFISGLHKPSYKDDTGYPFFATPISTPKRSHHKKKPSKGNNSAKK